MAERRRRRIAQEDRERLVRAFEETDQDYLVVADTLGVNRSTARGIITRYIRENRVHERQRGGRHNIKVNEEMRQCLEDILSENPMLTLEAVNAQLRERLLDHPHSSQTFGRNVIHPEVGTQSSSRSKSSRCY